jgi:hypothetical protein
MARENEAEVLEYLNSLRVEYGIGEPLAELPPDLPSSDLRTVSEGCPVAVALETQCGIGGVTLVKNGYPVSVEFPKFVTNFQLAHDDRRSYS